MPLAGKARSVIRLEKLLTYYELLFKMYDPKKYDKGLVWNEKDEFIDQSWQDLKTKIQNTHGGLGIIAADFDELIRYGYGQGVWKRRNHFTKLVADAKEEDDIELLAEILAIILLRPWKTNPHGGWFIHRLRRGANLEEFDAERAALVLNELYDIHQYAAEVLIRTLTDYIDTHQNELRLLKLITETGKLRQELVLAMNPSSVFISYAKEDNALAERLYSDLKMRELKVWKDSHELLPGEKWEHKIRKTLKEYEFVILCLSLSSIKKVGFFQEELKIATALQRKRPSSAVYIIPIRFDEFDENELPPEIENLHYIDMFLDWDKGIEIIAKTIYRYRRSI